MNILHSNKKTGKLDTSPNPISNSLRTNTHVPIWRSWDGVETLVVVNPSWNLTTQFDYANFGPLALTCGCPFILQGQPLQV